MIKGQRGGNFVPASGSRLELGDVAAMLLARGWLVPFIKITPASYRRFKVRWGLADDCNCAERKEKLNRFGRWLATRPKLSAAFRRWLAGRGRSNK